VKITRKGKALENQVLPLVEQAHADLEASMNPKLSAQPPELACAHSVRRAARIHLRCNRQALYERFFFGPQNLTTSIYYDLCDKDSMIGRVAGLLDNA